jgi:DNA topoisomerase IB
LPRQELFQYVDDEGDVRDINSQDVNDYLREVTGQDFTAKDFLTWAGTVLVAMALSVLDPFKTRNRPGPALKMRSALLKTARQILRRFAENVMFIRLFSKLIWMEIRSKD